jgi:Zn-dependent protease
MKDITLGKLFKIPVKIGWSWLFLVAVVLFPFSGLSEFAFHLYVALSISLMVLMHEFGHGLMARYLGYEVQEIRLFALGGQAVIPDLANPTPKMEFLTTLAGPAVNLILGTIILILHFSLFYFGFIAPDNQLVALWWIANIAMGIFNLIPAFPLDGGRLFRAGLSKFFGHVIATRIATYLSFLLGGLMILFGAYMGSIMLIIVAVFVIVISYVERKGAERGEFE